jgi:hypothetical protein
MSNVNRPSIARQQAEAKFAKSEAHDAEYFRDRKEREAANIAKTLQLRALRLEKEAREREDAPTAAKKSKPKPRSLGS